MILVWSLKLLSASYIYSRYVKILSHPSCALCSVAVMLRLWSHKLCIWREKHDDLPDVRIVKWPFLSEGPFFLSHSEKKQKANQDENAAAI